ncbi:unnamed protein product [Urochloa decumbens]|uniref:Uncharacterized protein n=1 Tax=Urochloa decumbens TaxID=240449 RepID=A0ABC9D914_9POAL
MEAVELLTLGVAFIVFVSICRRGTATRPHHDRRRTIRISDPAVARRALIDHADAFSNRPMPPFPAGRPVTHGIASAPYGPFWRALRSNLAADILHRSRLGVLAPLEREATEALVASLTSQAVAGNGDGVIVPRNTIHSAVFALIARLCFGDDDAMDGRADLGAMVQTQREFLESFVVTMASSVRSWLARLLQWRQQLHAGMFDRVDEVFIPAVIAARRRRQSSQHGNGVGSFRSHIDSLLELHVPNNNNDDDERARRLLTDEEVAFLIWEFLGGGTLSVVTCLEWTLAHLATEPKIQSKLHRDVAGALDNSKIMAYDQQRLPFLHAVVMESLRLHPPTPFATRDVHADGIAALALGEEVVLPPGGGAAPVSFVLGDIGRDKKVWTNPDEFRPERLLDGGEGEGVSLVPGPKTEVKMMPFGAGRRHCPGVAMGMSHIKCFLAELVRGFEWAPLADGGGATDFAEVDGFRKMMKTPLRVRITPRSMK